MAKARPSSARLGTARQWQGQARQGLAPLGNGKEKHCLDMQSAARALDRSATHSHGDAKHGKAKARRGKDLRGSCIARASRGIETRGQAQQWQSTAGQRMRSHGTDLRRTAAANLLPPLGEVPEGRWGCRPLVRIVQRIVRHPFSQPVRAASSPRGGAKRNGKEM